jgi:hypothetical protein
MASSAVARRDQGGLLAALPPVDVEEYPALVDGIDGMIEVLGDNVGGKLELADLIRVSVPTGGDIDWKIPSKLGKDLRTEEIVAIPIHWADARTYWPGKDITHEPPHCWSTDGKTPSPDGLFGDFGARAAENPPRPILGSPTPVRSCAGCPMDQWGTAPENGKGKACKQQKLLFVLEEGATLPMLIAVPPTSLKSVRAAMIELTAKTRSHYSGFLLRFTLVKRSNGSNDYGEIQVELAGALTGVRPTKLGGPEPGSAAAASKAYSEAFGALITPEVLAAAAAGETEGPAADTDEMPGGLGGEFAEHGESEGT